MHEPVKDRVSQGFVLHGIMPRLDRQLTGDYGCLSVVHPLDGEGSLAVGFQAILAEALAKGDNAQNWRYW